MMLRFRPIPFFLATALLPGCHLQYLLGTIGDSSKREVEYDRWMEEQIEALVATDPATRRAAETALEAEVPRSLPYLHRAAARRDPERQRAALALLGRIAHPDSVDPLGEIVGAMHHPPEVIGDAAGALARIGRKEATPLLLAALAQAKTDYVRRRLLEALGALRDRRSCPALAAALEDPAYAVREAAIRALGLSPHPDALGCLIRHEERLPAEGRWEERREILAAWRRLGADAVVFGRARDYLASAVAGARLTGIAALEGLGGRPSIELLVESLKDASPETFAAAESTLERLTGKQAHVDGPDFEATRRATHAAWTDVLKTLP